jgi:hypothetical protein
VKILEPGLPRETCEATIDFEGEGIVQCTRERGHEAMCTDPLYAFHQHMSPGRPILRWAFPRPLVSGYAQFGSVPEPPRTNEPESD